MTRFLHSFVIQSLAAFGACLVLTALACADPSQDLLVGNGSPGPYPLSWKHIAAGTEIVQVNQQTQMRGLDYTLDADAGTVLFTRPLSAQSAASVHYEYDPARAVRVSLVTKVPLSFNLAEGSNSRVSFDALYQAGNGGGGAAVNAAPGKITLGLGTRLQGGASQLSTRLMFAPALGGQEGAQSGSSLSHMGISLSGSTQAARALQVSFGYTQAGAKMTTASDNGLAAGRQTLTLGTTLAPSSKMQASVNWAQSASTVAGGTAASTQTSAALSIAPTANLSLQTHWTEATGGSAPNTQTADVRLHAAPTTTSSVDAVFASKNNAGAGGDTQALNLAAALSPNKTLAVHADVGQTRDGNGAVNQQQVGLALTPTAAIQLQTSLALHQTPTAQTSTATVGGQVQPMSFFQFAATYKDRTASAGDTLPADALDTSLVRLTLLPLRGVSLTGSYAQNPDNNGSAPQRLAQRGLGLETTFGALSVSGGYDWQRQTDTQIVGTMLHVGVGLHLSQDTQLDGSYRQTLSGTGDSSTGANIFGFGLTRTLGDRFHLSLDGTMQKPVTPAVPANPDYTAHASLGMKF